MKMPLRVMRLWSGIEIGAVIQPSFPNEGWHRSAKFAVKTATSHFRGNHLAAVWQVGEGASLRRDAYSNMRSELERLQGLVQGSLSSRRQRSAGAQRCPSLLASKIFVFTDKSAVTSKFGKDVGTSRVATIAPHGGTIEPVTSKLAEATAGDSFNWYCFEGLQGNRRKPPYHLIKLRRTSMSETDRSVRCRCSATWPKR